MSKLNLAIGTNVFYENKPYTIQRTVDLKTVTIQSVDDKEDIINVHVSKLRATKEKKPYDLERYNDEEWDKAKEKYNIIKDLVFIKRTRQDVQDCAKKHNIGTTTLYAWISQYENTEQISSLVPKTKQRGKKGSRLSILTDKIIGDILEELYLTKQKTGFSKIYRHIKKECGRLNLATPHENTIRNRIKAIDPKLSMKKREGYKKAHQAYSNFEGEFPEGNYPLDVIQIDHTPLDIQIVDTTYRKAIGRPYLTIAIDVYSRMITGFYLSLQAPGYFSVSQCLLHSFLPKETFLKEQKIEGEWNIFGVPRIIHVDNGQDLVSKDMQKVCEDLHITLMKRPVANPQFGAHVERVFGTINKEIHNLSGSTFRNVQAKGDYDSVKKATFTLEELTRWLTQYITNAYHKEIHHGLGMSPDEKYHQGIFGDETTAGTGVLPSILLNEEDIKIMLMKTEYRFVQKNGIALNGITYYSDLLRHWINKKNDKGEKISVKVKYDPMNMKKIYFFDSEVKEYFEAYTRNTAAPSMTLWDIKAAKDYLKEKNISSYNEQDIFDAYEALENIEREAEENTKNTKLRKNKTPKMRDQKNKAKETQNKDTSHLDDLFKDVKTFNVYSKSNMEK